MKEIQPVTMWNGIEGIYLNAWGTNVTLNISAVFSYNILNVSQERLVEGELIMTGEAYTQWTVDQYAWDWIAEQLNLTIIGDYVPPVIEEVKSSSI
jgi:hypothetical protein